MHALAYDASRRDHRHSPLAKAILIFAAAPTAKNRRFE